MGVDDTGDGPRCSGEGVGAQRAVLRLSDDAAAATAREAELEAELRDVRARLDVFLQALDTMQVGLCLTDAERHILYVNRAEAEMHGYRSEELIGRPVSVFAPPQLRGRGGALDLSRIRSWKREAVNQRRDGSIFPVELLSDTVIGGDGRPLGLITTSQDISERRSRERALEEIHERYSLAVAGSHDGIWDWDVAAGWVHYSARWRDMVGLDGQALGKLDDWLERVHPEDRDEFRESLFGFLEAGGDHFEAEHRLLHADGSYRYMLARGATVRRPGTGALRMVGSLTDVTERRVHDPLTGLPNRLLLQERLDHALRRRARVEEELAVMFLDLDGFKVVNDSLGHLFGDEVLTAVAERLAEAVGRGRLLARVGGDEFVVVLEGGDGAEEASEVAADVHRALEQPVAVEDKELFVTLSIGIALAAARPPSPQGVTAHDLLREADTAMYKAKARGRGRTLVFDESMRSLALEELELGNQLRQALDLDELEVYYQPVFSTADRRIVGAEALVRWQHPGRGLLAPDSFLHLAEETGLIVPIGRRVLSRACAQAREWVDALGADHEFSVSVNFSPQEIAHRGFVSAVRDELAASGLEPERLRLEVTEATLIRDRPTVVGKLTELRELGVVVTVDDFGTGYSSLSYLDHLPVDVLKIDRSFVLEIDRLPSRKNVVQSILRMAAELGIEVVAEGAETEGQLAELVSLRCAFFQGHALAHASPAREISRMLGFGE